MGSSSCCPCPCPSCRLAPADVLLGGGGGAAGAVEAGAALTSGHAGKETDENEECDSDDHHPDQQKDAEHTAGQEGILVICAGGCKNKRRELYCCAHILKTIFSLYIYKFV